MLGYVRKNILSSEFFKQVMTLMSGAAIGQAIMLLTAPVITHLYTPEEMGFYAIYMAVVSGISVIAAFRYEMAIILPKDEMKAIKLVTLGVIIALFVSVLSFIVIFILWLIFPQMSSWMMLVPLSVFALAVYNIYFNWSNRRKNYKRIAGSRIINAIVNTLVTISAGFLKVGSIGLIGGNLSGQSAASLKLMEIRKLLKSFRETHKAELLSVLKEYKSLPFKNAPHALLGMYKLNGLVYLIPVFFATNVVGWYALAMRVLQSPISLLGNALSQVFYRKVSETYNANGNVHRLVRLNIINAAILALPVLIVLLFWGTELFAFVFGKEWKMSGVYAGILAPWIYLDFIRMSVGQVPIVLDRMKGMLVYSFTGSLFITACILVSGWYFEDIEKGFYWLSASMSVLHIVYIGWIYSIARKKAEGSNE